MEEKQRFSLSLHQVDDFEFRVRFDGTAAPDLVTDEPEPLGHGAGPNPSRLLAAAVANCLAASLLFALRKFKNRPDPVSAEVSGEMGRNEQGRLRVETITVDLRLGAEAADMQHLDRILAQFEDFCVVTQSVRQGIAVRTRVTDAAGVVLKEDS